MNQFYPLVKDIHSYWRWLILALAVFVIIKYLAGWLGKQKFTSLDNRLNLFFITALDIQLLLGLLLYFFLSPITHLAMKATASAMSDSTIRLYSIEHPLTMLIAIALAHIGRVMVKRSATDTAKFKRGFIYFTLSLIFMLSRMPW